MDEPARGSLLKSVGWGLFLASSWTWCIGAFLPLLLLRNWGWTGFVVFAVPNVLGAAAVGFLWTRERSKAYVERRRTLLAWFSAATISYQAFFIGWMAPVVVEATLGAGDGRSTWSAWTSWFAALGAFAIVVAGGRGGDRAWIGLGTIVTLGSFALWARHGAGGWSEIGAGGAAPRSEIWLLAPAIWLGFLVCPHLDLTFHRVIQRDGTRTPWIVFAPVFLMMLLFAASAFTVGGARDRAGEPAFVVITSALAAWWFIQVSFTAAAHARELRASPAPWARALVPLALIVGAVAGRPDAADESTYLRFLGLYGALFPPVALLLWRGRSPLAILVFLAIAIPAFELGFLGPGGGGNNGPGVELDGNRWAWAPLVPIVLLLGMLAFPGRIDRTRAREA